MNEFGAVFWSPLLFLWCLLKRSKIILFCVGAAVERFRKRVLMKEINKAKKASTASSHFGTDGHAPDVPLS